MKRLDPARLRERREERGLTLEELARRTGYDRVTLWRIERGKSSPRKDTLAHLAKALGVTAADLAIDGAASPDRRTPERLSDLVDTERSSDVATSSLGERAPALTARALESIYTAYAAHEGERCSGRFSVKRQAPLSEAERVALGAARGAGARFALETILSSGAVLDVTAHAATIETTRAVQEARGRQADIVLRVVTFDRDAFAFFGSRGLHGWTFVVESAKE